MKSRRLFVGIPIPKDISLKIEPLCKELKSIDTKINVTSSESYHFTLQFLGDVEVEKIPLILLRITSFLKGISPFDIEIKNISVFPSKKEINVVWVGATNLYDFMKKIQCELEEFHTQEYKKIVPHLTIARISSSPKKAQLHDFLKKYNSVSFGKLNIAEIVLYESVLEKSGPKYIKLKTFNFR